MLRSVASQENHNCRLNIVFLIFLAKTFGLVAIFWFQYINICAGASPANTPLEILLGDEIYIGRGISGPGEKERKKKLEVSC